MHMRVTDGSYKLRLEFLATSVSTAFVSDVEDQCRVFTPAYTLMYSQISSRKSHFKVKFKCLLEQSLLFHFRLCCSFLFTRHAVRRSTIFAWSHCELSLTTSLPTVTSTSFPIMFFMLTWCLFPASFDSSHSTTILFAFLSIAALRTVWFHICTYAAI